MQKNKNMKYLKIVYIISISLCAFQLLLFLVMPFGGPLGIFHLMEDGMFSAQSGFTVIPTNEMYYPNNIYVPYLGLFNRICTIGYFMSLVGACLSLALIKFRPINKYKIGIIFFILAVIFVYVGQAIWRYYVGVYIENR